MAGRDKPVHIIVHVLIRAAMITLLDLCRKLLAQQLLRCSYGSTSIPMADTLGLVPELNTDSVEMKRPKENADIVTRSWSCIPIHFSVHIRGSLHYIKT